MAKVMLCGETERYVLQSSAICQMQRMAELSAPRLSDCPCVHLDTKHVGIPQSFGT